MGSQERFGRESRFHDDWALSTDAEAVHIEAAFTAPTAMENRYILSALGDLSGRTLLDVGCGLGESSVMFAELGADVTSNDLSSEMLVLTSRLAARRGLSVTTCHGPAENLDLPPGSFDVVYAANVIHHLSDADAFYQAILRLLKPGGVFISWDPVKYNPAINIYRRMASEVRSEDEYPLGMADLAKARSYFGKVEVRFFWLSTLILFLKYYFIDKVDPNKERYWKRIYAEDEASLRWWQPFYCLDRLLTRIPGLRWLSWNMVMISRNPGSSERS